MDGHVEAYEHPLVSARAKRALLALERRHLVGPGRHLHLHVADRLDGAPHLEPAAVPRARRGSVPGPHRLGHRVEARLAPATATSAATPVQIGRFRIAKTLRILGEARVGSVLKLSGKVSPKPAKAVYVWQRNGKPIAGARGKTYTLVAADFGSRITVVVRCSSPDYELFKKKTRPTVVVQN